MTRTDGEKTAAYEITMFFIRKWLDEGLISRDDYYQIDTKMLEKYRPYFGSLFSDPALL